MGKGNHVFKAIRIVSVVAAIVAAVGCAFQTRMTKSGIYIYGRSVGTGIAAHLAQGKPVAGLILESPYTSLRGMIYREFRFMLPFLYLSYTLDIAGKLGNVTAPILIMHGTRDEVIAFKYGKSLAESPQGRKTFVPIEGGGHNDLDRFPAKREALAAFLKS